MKNSFKFYLPNDFETHGIFLFQSNLVNIMCGYGVQKLPVRIFCSENIFISFL